MTPNHTAHAPILPIRSAAAAVSAPPALSALSVRSEAPRYVAEVVPDVEAFLARCDRLATAHSLPFHATPWLRAWYATLGQADGRRALPVAVRDLASGRDVALLPLVESPRRGLRIVEFADAGVCDYAAPILADAWHGGAAPAPAAAALWRAVRQALHGCDVFLVDKLLGELLDQPPALPLDAPDAAASGASAARCNPLMLALPVRPSELFGNQFSAPQGWEAWRHSLDKTVRKEIERCWRNFHREPTARFEQITDLAEAHALFAVLERQQSERMSVLQGPLYRLDQPAYRAFYRQAIDGGLASGQVVLTVLRVGDEVVSALFGVANAVRYVALRQSVAGAAWKAVSPGRLLDEQTAHAQHDAGRTNFDFGIGDYHHKAALKLQPIALYQACVALSWRGWPVVGGWRLKQWAKHQAWAPAVKRRLAALKQAA